MSVGLRAVRTNKLTEAQQASVLRHFLEWRDSLPDLTDAAAGQILGLSQGSINAIKHGRANLSTTTLILLRDAVGISIDEILGLPPLPPKEPQVPVKTPISDRDAMLEAAIEAGIERALARRLGATPAGTEAAALPPKRPTRSEPPKS